MNKNLLMEENHYGAASANVMVDLYMLVEADQGQLAVGLHVIANLRSLSEK